MPPRNTFTHLTIPKPDSRQDVYHCDAKYARAWFAADEVNRINAFSLATKWALHPPVV